MELNKRTLDDIDNKRIMGQLEKLVTYNLTFHYVPKKMNKIADGLTRFPVDGPEEEEDDRVGVAKVRRVFLGRGEVEIFPKNVTDMVEVEDAKYKVLQEFFEGSRD